MDKESGRVMGWWAAGQTGWDFGHSAGDEESMPTDYSIS